MSMIIQVSYGSLTTIRSCGPAAARRLVALALSLVLFWVTAQWSRAQASEPSPSSARDAFPTLAIRNLFDPDRTRAQQSSPEFHEETPSVRPHTEFIKLTGTMIHGYSAYAFFGGSRSEYSQIVKAHERIAHFTVAQITTSHVILQNDTNQLILPVGQQLRREGTAPWQVGNAILADSPSPGASPPDADSPTDTSSTPPPSSEEMDEVLKRMMERRNKEMSP